MHHRRKDYPRARQKRFLTATAMLALCTSHALAEQIFPGPDWKERPDPLASPDAEVGGQISIFAGQYPKSLNYYLDNNVFSYRVTAFMYESLLGTDGITADYVPNVAEKWSISEDKLSFTFWIDKRAHWSDGRPITAEDVKFTFDTIMDPKNLTGIHKVALEAFESPEIIDDHTIRFRTKEVHWRNLGACGGQEILPKHAYQDVDFNKVNFEFPVTSGPMKIGKIKEGIFVKMERRADWWGWQKPGNQNTFNFETMDFRFFAERENAFEAFKKGQIDIYPVYTSRLWVNETKGEKFDKNWIIKQRITNYSPQGFQGFAMNTRDAPFDDVGVRRAMAHLLDREKMNRTLMYNQYKMHRSYFEDLYSSAHPNQNPYYEFDKDKARELLKQAGWKTNPDSGLLEKDGRAFRFKFLTRSPTSEKFLSIYGEDLKDVGIELEIEQKDWAAWAKDMDEFNFSMTWAAWGSSLRKDPEGMWAAKEATRKAGNNYTGFMSDKVDAMIESQKTIFDIERRNQILREIDALVAADVPYALLWYIDYVRLLYWNRFGTPATVLSKYGDESAAYTLWWYDEDAAADLGDAMQSGDFLPKTAPAINFDDAFSKPDP
ncbi:MAG: extracellular solute-binding protein [Verrucomicrobia bacterium]|nr:extracellular solute-binding protein [Verrucomicrobiota bacterium]